MTTISERLQAIRNSIAECAISSGRLPESVGLVAVSKTQPAGALREAFAAGQRMFGESYLQESLDKMALLSELPIEWHFIGPIQSNKTRPIAEHFHWVHGVDRLKIAQRLSDSRLDGHLPLQVCLQVNVSGEQSKSGCVPGELAELAFAVSKLPRLKLRGLMAIPEPTTDILLQRSRFRMLRELFEILNRQGLQLDTLSMGMSEDYPAAITEGATLVRVGTAIFGPRIQKIATEPQVDR